MISTFVFTTWMIQSLYFLNPKFQASSHLQWLYSLVCARPGQNPHGWFSLIVTQICGISMLTEAGPTVKTRSWNTKITRFSSSRSAMSLACPGSSQSLSMMSRKTAFPLISWPLLRQKPASETTSMHFRQLIGKKSEWSPGPRGYKTFFMLDSAEHKIQIMYKSSQNQRNHQSSIYISNKC